MGFQLDSVTFRLDRATCPEAVELLREATGHPSDDQVSYSTVTQPPATAMYFLSYISRTTSLAEL